MSIDAELAAARAARREIAWVTQRLTVAREERARLAEQLAIAEQARSYEQVDVDRLTRGIGALFRGIVRGGQLTAEQEELAAARLLCDSLAEELRAADVDVAQLETRAAAVADANERYARVLGALEQRARAEGRDTSELDAIASAEAEVVASRREVAEAIDCGRAADRSLRGIVDLVRTLDPYNPHGDQTQVLGENLLRAILGRTSYVYRDLCRTVAEVHRRLHRFDDACHRLAFDLPAPISLAVSLPPVESFVLRDVLWSSVGTLEAVLPELSRTTSALAGRIGELRERDAGLARALDECARIRSRVLDPAG